MQRSDEEARALAQQVAAIGSPDQQRQMLFSIKAQDPALYQLVASYVESYQNIPSTMDQNEQTNGVQGPSSSSNGSSNASQSSSSSSGSGANDVANAATAPLK